MSGSLSVALDATLWDDPTTGIGQYARCLAGALEGIGVRVALLGAAHSGDAPRGAGVGRSAFVLGALPELLAGRGEATFHAVGNFNLPLGRVPGKRLVLTVHDLIPELLPETVSRSFRWQFRLWLARSLAVADQVICVSRATQSELLRLHPDLTVPTTVVHHGVDHVEEKSSAEIEAWYRGLALPAEYFLYAGALDARKNVSRLLDAHADLWRRGSRAPLVLVGQRWFGSGNVERQVEQLRSAKVDVRPLGYQPSGHLYRLMRGATAFVFPSRYEGFGLPPLEAMRLGTPAVVSDAGALPEVCGDAAFQVPCDDTDALVGAMASLLDHPEERHRRAEEGQRWATSFTWRRAAEQTRLVYERAHAI